MINLILELGPKQLPSSKIPPFQNFNILYKSLPIHSHFKTFINVNNSDEVTEIVNWLLFLGKDITIREMPEEILENLQKQLCFYTP